MGAVPVTLLTMVAAPSNLALSVALIEPSVAAVAGFIEITVPVTTMGREPVYKLPNPDQAKPFQNSIEAVPAWLL
jgi:hypothetical protein